MDVQTGLVYVAVVVISAAVIVLVSMFGIKEKSYEEAIAEQRKLPDDLLLGMLNLDLETFILYDTYYMANIVKICVLMFIGKKDKGKEKKHKNKAGKKVKEKKEEKEEKDDKEEKPEHIQFEENPQILPLEPLVRVSIQIKFMIYFRKYMFYVYHFYGKLSSTFVEVYHFCYKI